MKLALTPLLLLALLSPAPLSRAADAPANDEVDKLIEQLGDGVYAKREEAAKRLKAIRKPALPALKQAAAGDDAEVAARAQAILKRIDIPALPAPDPHNPAGRVNNGVRVSMVDGDRVVEVNDAGRDIRITDNDDGGITMSVTGLVDGKPATVDYTAKDADQLKADSPDAYRLYQRWVDSMPRGIALRGGVLQLGGGGFARPFPVVPDELEQLRAHLDKQMKDAKVKEKDRDEVTAELDKLVDARTDRLPNQGMDKYTEQCDAFRKTLEQHKLDAGEFLPPPARTRLGVSISTLNNRMTIQQVSEKSRAERLGLQPGDLVRKIDGKEVNTVADLRKLVGAKESGLVVEITRAGEDLKLEEKAPEKKAPPAAK